MEGASQTEKSTEKRSIQLLYQKGKIQERGVRKDVMVSALCSVPTTSKWSLRNPTSQVWCLEHTFNPSTQGEADKYL